MSTSNETRTLEFWRSIIAECLASFFYVFLVCSVHISWTGAIVGHQFNWLVMAMTSGFAMTTLTQCFQHISGANVNPAITLSFLITRKITSLRASLYIIAQCGGAIAGAALLYGVSIHGHQGALGISMPHERLSAGQIFGVEFALTFLIVFTIFATLDTNRKTNCSDPLSVGIAYLVASLTGLPASGASFNPARALGPAFVMNRWKYHWVYWVAPISGGMLAALIYEFIFDTKKMATHFRKTLDDLDKGINADGHYEEPELKIGNKNHLPYSSSSTSASSSSSTHHSNNPLISPPPNVPPHYTAYGQTQGGANFTHQALTHEGIYMDSNLQNAPSTNNLPLSTNYHQLNASYGGGGGLYGTNGRGTLRHLNSRLDFNRDTSINPNQKY